MPLGVRFPLNTSSPSPTPPTQRNGCTFWGQRMLMIRVHFRLQDQVGEEVAPRPKPEEEDHSFNSMFPWSRRPTLLFRGKSFKQPPSVLFQLLVPISLHTLCSAFPSSWFQPCLAVLSLVHQDGQDNSASREVPVFLD